ncbi:MAG: class I SAM-dependent methyltransferase [Actinobacteria bacterium]|nr:class I SAM-dependent methyltransferase [Actinomycetota bacterium]
MKDISSIGQVVTARHRFLMKMAGDLGGIDILDLGCSFGWFEQRALRDRASRVVGLDLDPVQIRRAESEAHGAELHVRDITSELADLGSFDLVCAFDAVEHLPKGSEAGFLENVMAVLKPGGRLLISVPYRSFFSCTLDPAFYFGHRHYSLDSMEALLRASGFSVTGRAFAGGPWWMFSMIWLYMFKWVFRRDMPFYRFLEEKRTGEHERFTRSPGLRSFATMFIEARPCPSRAV